MKKDFHLSSFVKERALLVPICLSLLIIGLSCSGPLAPPKLFGIDRENIGVIKGNTMKVYGRQGHQQWEHVPHNTFTPPGDMKDYFITGEKIGVYRTSGRVDFYKNLAPGKWEIIPDNQYFKIGFQGPKDADHAYDGGSGITYFINGRNMKYYRDGSADPAYDFIAPEGTTFLFACSGGLAACSKTGIDLYSFSFEKTKWELNPICHLNYPQGKIGVLPICGDMCLGIIKEKQVDIYFMDIVNGPKFYDSFSYPK